MLADCDTWSADDTINLSDRQTDPYILFQRFKD